jgi:class 3 adenylate cyclase
MAYDLQCSSTRCMLGVGVGALSPAAGPVVVQGGDYFGRTVNLAARLAARAGPGQVLVSGAVAESAAPAGVRLVEVGRLRLAGIARPVRVLEARGA